MDWLRVMRGTDRLTNTRGLEQPGLIATTVLPLPGFKICLGFLGLDICISSYQFLINRKILGVFIDLILFVNVQTLLRNLPELSRFKVYLSLACIKRNSDKSYFLYNRD